MTLRAAGLLAWTLLVAACGSGHARPAHLTKHPRTDTPARVRPAASTAVPAPSPLPQALVTDEAQSRLLAVDLPSGRIARSVPVASDPQDIATTGDGGLVIVVSSSAGKVTALDRGTLRTIKTFGGFDQPHIAAISPDGEYAYITDDSRGTLTTIRLSDMKVTSTISVGPEAHHLAFSLDERQVWVALGETAHEITILTTVASPPGPTASPVDDLGHPRVIGHFTPSSPAHDLAFSPDGRTVWVTSATGTNVTVFDVRNHHALFQVPVGAPPQHLAFHGGAAYLTSGYAGAIEKVNTATGHLLARSTSPYGSFELAANDGYVAAASLLRGTLAIYTPDLKLLRIVKLAPATREVALSRP